MDNVETEVGKRLSLARTMAESARQIVLKYFCGQELETELKKDGSPVTVADRSAEEHLRSEITRTFPDDAILGEEFPEQPGSSGYRWLLDPIDGTKSFVHGVPLFGTLIAVEKDEQCVAGVVMLPALHECVYAAKGKGAWHQLNEADPVPAQVSSVERLADSLFCTTSVRSYAKLNRWPVFEQLSSQARFTRTWGDCYGYVLVATGRAEVMIDPIVNSWDAGPMLTILEEAGGSLTDWQGNRTVHGGDCIATNGKVLNDVLQFTRGK